MKSQRSFALWKRIHVALYKEIETEYSNTSIKEGFSHFLQKVSTEEWFVQEYPNSLRDSLVQSLQSYEVEPSTSTYAQLVSSIGSLYDYWDNQIPTAVMQDILLKPLQYCKGFGPKRAQVLSRLGIYKIYDFLYTFPKSWNDRRKTNTIQEAYMLQGETVQIAAYIDNVVEQKKGSFLITNLVVKDKTGFLLTTFINQKYLKKMFQDHKGHLMFLSGKVQYQYGKIQMNNPEFEIQQNSKSSHTFHDIVPIYKLTEGMSQKVYRQLIRHTIEEHIVHIHEFLPSSIRIPEHIMHRAEALCHMHFPMSLQVAEEARKRLVLDEFLMNQYTALQHKILHRKKEGIKLSIPDTMVSSFQSLLSFSLTGDQQKTVLEFRQDLASGYPMNRLLHGDVGSGKTIVAAALLYFTIKNQYQAIFMAPTEILAKQVFQVLTTLFLSDETIQGVLLIGDMKKKEREKAEEALQLGTVNFAVGTHALFEDKILFHRPATFIIDEQHRFGVEQRKRLFGKALHPHLLVMSATPIPRTMALTQFGDLDVSVIQELPQGQKNIQTKIVSSTQRSEMNRILRTLLEKNEKIYFVCPLIEESDSLDVANSIHKTEEVKTTFPDIDVFLLHGRMKMEEKNQVMHDFRQAKRAILVSTTVIEVGVDVSEATAMVIENAERFGLAQLHQLRGRVGRKSQQSYCFLVTDASSSSRLAILETTNNGFAIAEKDLELRGPGELFGTLQSGHIFSQLVRLEEDYPLLEKAKEIATHLINHSDIGAELEKAVQFRNKKVVL
ncbi:MAG: ATP-dependent DNA helicase RecG [Caldisericia bacterium]|nr:ATP-dependent DNA helicase RecG [Caldisericia bacterium]